MHFLTDTFEAFIVELLDDSIPSVSYDPPCVHSPIQYVLREGCGPGGATCDENVLICIASALKLVNAQ